MRHSRARGFTLIELLVVIAIVAIMAALAFPSFESSMRSNRVATTTNEMLASLALARGEAIRSSRSSRLCASSNGTSCTTDWNLGWLVATDNDGNGSFEQILRFVPAHQRLLIAGTAPKTIVFDYRGRPTPVTSAGTITLQPDQCPASQPLVRTLTLNSVGQVRTSKGTCP